MPKHSITTDYQYLLVDSYFSHPSALYSHQVNSKFFVITKLRLHYSRLSRGLPLQDSLVEFFILSSDRVRRKPDNILESFFNQKSSQFFVPCELLYPRSDTDRIVGVDK